MKNNTETSYSQPHQPPPSQYQPHPPQPQYQQPPPPQYQPHPPQPQNQQQPPPQYHQPLPTPQYQQPPPPQYQQPPPPQYQQPPPKPQYQKQAPPPQYKQHPLPQKPMQTKGGFSKKNLAVLYVIIVIAIVVIASGAGVFLSMPKESEKNQKMDENEDGGGNGNGNDGNGNGDSEPFIPEIPANFTVTVPEKKLGDWAFYDYTIFAEMYSENKTSGEWKKYTLYVTGQLIDEIKPDIAQKRDGFNLQHSTVAFQEETAATLEIIIDSSDNEKVNTHGDLAGVRTEYTDINDEINKIVIQTATRSSVEVDPMPKIPISLKFDGDLRNYPNPNVIPEESLDEAIYLGNKGLKINDSDSILKKLDSEENWVSEGLTQTYSWTVEGYEKVAGFDTLFINITTDYQKGFEQLNKKIWIANEVSFPVKVFERTNTSFNDEDSYNYIILEHERTLQDKANNFIRGTKDIPWGACDATLHYHERHPRGEFLEWKEYSHLPKGGTGFDESSFDFNPQDAEDHARENSSGLNLFLASYDDVVVNWGVYKAEKDEKDIQGKAGSYNWNLSFGYKPTNKEKIEAWEAEEEPHWGYFVNLTRNVTKEPGFDRYSEEIKIINEDQYDYGDAPLSKKDIDDETLTLASSEGILILDEDVQNEAYSILDNEINFQDTSYVLTMGDRTTSNIQGLEIIETITGITLPISKYSWVIQKGDLSSTSGQMFSAAVDAETGQLLYVIKMDGTELYQMFE